MQAFLGSTYNRDETLKMAKDAAMLEWMTSMLYERPEELFGVPLEVGNTLYATLVEGREAQGLPRFLDAIAEGADLASLPPAVSAWLLATEVPRCVEEAPALGRLVRVFTHLHQLGHQNLITEDVVFEQVFESLWQRPSASAYGIAALIFILRERPSGAIWAVTRAHMLVTGSDTVIREAITAKVVQLLRDCQPVH